MAIVPRKLMALAYHEAGHAVIGRMLGFSVKLVRIERTSTEEWSGNVVFDDPQPTRESQTQIAIAGLLTVVLWQEKTCRNFQEITFDTARLSKDIDEIVSRYNMDRAGDYEFSLLIDGRQCESRIPPDDFDGDLMTLEDDDEMVRRQEELPTAARLVSQSLEKQHVWAAVRSVAEHLIALPMVRHGKGTLAEIPGQSLNALVDEHAQGQALNFNFMV